MIELLVAEVFVRFYVKGKYSRPEIINFFLICVNLQKFTN